RAFGRVCDRILASDPAFSRLRMASRAILSALIGIGLLAGLATVFPVPMAAYGLVIVTAFPGAMSIKDKTVRDQIVSRAVACGVAIAAACLASLLAATPVVADITFL